MLKDSRHQQKEGETLISTENLWYTLYGKGKGIPIIGHEGPWGMWMQGSTYSQPRH